MSFLAYLAALFAVVWGGPMLVECCYLLAFRRSVVRKRLAAGEKLAESLAVAGALYPPQHYPADHTGGAWGQGEFVPGSALWYAGGEGFGGHCGHGFDGGHGGHDGGGCGGGCAHGT